MKVTLMKIGYVGFFDEVVSKVEEFDGDTNILEIKPVGRGGTNFHNVFKYAKDNMSDNLPNTIIILSDGYADFPKEKETMNIPTMWVFNNKDSATPSFGKTIRIHN